MKSRSSTDQERRVASLALARFFEASWPSNRRNATTGSFFGSNSTKKMPQGCYVESGRRRWISSIFAAARGVDPEFLGRELEDQVVRDSSEPSSIGQPISSRR